MPLTSNIKNCIDSIYDYLFSNGYPNPIQNAEQLNFMIYFCMYEVTDTARKSGTFKGAWTLRNPRNAHDPDTHKIHRKYLRWSHWSTLRGEHLVNWVRDEVFPFHAEIATKSDNNFMKDARLAIDDPSVLSYIIDQLNTLSFDTIDTDTKGDIFEHVLHKIRQAGKLGQFRTPRHIIRSIIQIINPRIGETIFDPAAGTAGFLVGAWDHIRLANSSPNGIEKVDIDGKIVQRGTGDALSKSARRQLQEDTFYGTDVDPQMVRLATMNLTLRGLDQVRILNRNALASSLTRMTKISLGLPKDGFDVILANPPFSRRMDRDRIVEEVKVLRTTQTEILFLQYILNHLKDGGRCGVIVPEGVLFGSTGAHKEIRRKLIEFNQVKAVISLPNGVFNPYSNVKTSVLIFRKGGATGRVLFVDINNDGFKLDANHNQPIDDDDLPGLAKTFRKQKARWKTWCERDLDVDWTKNWWFADADTICAADYDLSVKRYRPLRVHSSEEHRDPMEILKELRDIEVEILKGTDRLMEMMREVP